MYTVQKRTPTLEVVLETGTMIVRMMRTAARTTVKRVVMMARLTLQVRILEKLLNSRQRL
jgi:hypothetical protein